MQLLVTFELLWFSFDWRNTREPSQEEVCMGKGSKYFSLKCSSEVILGALQKIQGSRSSALNFLFS